MLHSITKSPEWLIVDNLKDPKTQVELCRHVLPFVTSLFNKITGCHDSHSILGFPKQIGLYYSCIKDGIYTFRAGANILVEIPERLIKDIDAMKIRFLMNSYVVIFNGISIPDNLWRDNPLIDASTLIDGVRSSVTDISGSKIRLRGVRQLLPPNFPKQHSHETTRNGVPKLLQLSRSKLTTIKIKEKK